MTVHTEFVESPEAAISIEGMRPDYNWVDALLPMGKYPIFYIGDE